MKRVFDVLVSILLLVLLWPVMVTLAIGIKATTRGPILYRARRIGQHGRLFGMWKFRSMIVGADRLGASSTPVDDPRMTPLGRWMRRYKLDELPQLFNVLVGEMSFVGPRPQVAWAVERYSAEERILLTVRPGITDPASLRFANEGEILRGSSDPDGTYFDQIHSEKMRLSMDYVRNHTFRGDLLILIATLRAALARPVQAHRNARQDSPVA